MLEDLDLAHCKLLAGRASRLKRDLLRALMATVLPRYDHNLESQPDQQQGIRNSSVWEASIAALDLSFETGTWWQQPRHNIVDGIKKKSKRKPRFNDKVELHVGHAQDLDMVAWPIALGSNDRNAMIFKPHPSRPVRL